MVNRNSIYVLNKKDPDAIVYYPTSSLSIAPRLTKRHETA